MAKRINDNNEHGGSADITKKLHQTVGSGDTGEANSRKHDQETNYLSNSHSNETSEAPQNPDNVITLESEKNKNLSVVSSVGSVRSVERCDEEPIQDEDSPPQQASGVTRANISTVKQNAKDQFDLQEDVIDPRQIQQRDEAKLNKLNIRLRFVRGDRQPTCSDESETAVKKMRTEMNPEAINQSSHSSSTSNVNHSWRVIVLGGSAWQGSELTDVDENSTSSNDRSKHQVSEDNEGSLECKEMEMQQVSDDDGGNIDMEPQQISDDTGGSGNIDMKPQQLSEDNGSYIPCNNVVPPLVLKYSVGEGNNEFNNVVPLPVSLLTDSESNHCHNDIGQPHVLNVDKVDDITRSASTSLQRTQSHQYKGRRSAGRGRRKDYSYANCCATCGAVDKPVLPECVIKHQRMEGNGDSTNEQIPLTLHYVESSESEDD